MIPPDMREEWIMRQARERPAAERAAFLARGRSDKRRIDGLAGRCTLGLMARRIRIEYAGAVYHVMSWGDHLEAVYREDADRELFLKCLAEACEKTGWQIHPYVLMGNHYRRLLSVGPHPAGRHSSIIGPTP
jgi:hypothetical protein